MKNPIKQYFLFFSDWQLIVYVIVLMVSAVAMGIFAVINEEAATIFFKKYILIYVAAILINALLTYIIKSAYITPYDASGSPIRLFAVLVTEKCEKKIITKSVWEKGVKYIITRNNFDLSMHPDGLKGKTKTNCHIAGKYKNSLVVVPVTLALKYDGEVDQLSLFYLLLKNHPDCEGHYSDNIKKTLLYHELSFDDYLEETFAKLNEKNQSKFDEIISRYAQLTISDAEFLSELLDVVEFPERIFSCITDTKICLGTPETSACKGVMCKT